jgi:hypothetical protein
MRLFGRLAGAAFRLHEVAFAGGAAVEGGAVAGVAAAGRNGKLGPGAAPPALQAHDRALPASPRLHRASPPSTCFSGQSLESNQHDTW